MWIAVWSFRSIQHSTTPPPKPTISMTAFDLLVSRPFIPFSLSWCVWLPRSKRVLAENIPSFAWSHFRSFGLHMAHLICMGRGASRLVHSYLFAGMYRLAVRIITCHIELTVRKPGWSRHMTSFLPESYTSSVLTNCITRRSSRTSARLLSSFVTRRIPQWILSQTPFATKARSWCGGNARI